MSAPWKRCRKGVKETMLFYWEQRTWCTGLTECSFKKTTALSEMGSTQMQNNTPSQISPMVSMFITSMSILIIACKGCVEDCVNEAYLAILQLGDAMMKRWANKESIKVWIFHKLTRFIAFYWISTLTRIDACPKGIKEFIASWRRCKPCFDLLYRFMKHYNDVFFTEVFKSSDMQAILCRIVFYSSI